MFDFAWSEIALIAVVALIAIGPKDMPVAIRAITRVLKKMRRMAAEFQHHVDDMMREADLADVQSTFRDLRGMNLKNTLTNVMDSDGSLGRAFGDPFAEHKVPPVRGSSAARSAALKSAAPPHTVPPGPAPAFIPPAATIAASPAIPPAPPAFVPPGVPHPATTVEDI